MLAANVRPSYTLLETVKASEWEAAEQKWIKHHRDVGAALVNSNDGGAGNIGWVMGDEQRSGLSEITRLRETGSVRSPERRAQMSEDTRRSFAAGNRRPKGPVSEEGRRNIAAGQRGRKWSPEHRAKLSAAHQNVSEETRQKLRDAWARRPEEKKIGPGASGKGRPKSEEHKKKISEAHKGKQKSEETKQKLRDAHLGKKHSEETKKKIADTCRAVSARNQKEAA